MNRKRVILLALVLALVLATAGVVYAAPGGLRWTSGLGGGTGGGISSSAGFDMKASGQGAVSVSSSSASYEMCAGFQCADSFYNVSLPSVHDN